MTRRFAALSDELLLERFASGQRSAADELLRRYQAVAYRVAHRILRNQADAQDAVQEGFAKAFAHLLDFQKRSSFKTWLLRIVSNAAWLLLRKRRLRQTSIHSDEIVCARDALTPLEQLIEQEEKASAKALLETIYRILKSRATPKMRRVLRRLVKGRTLAQIAEELGCCEKTVWSIKARLRALVLRELAALGYSVR